MSASEQSRRGTKSRPTQGRGRSTSAIASGMRSLSTAQKIGIGLLVLFLVATLAIPLRTFAQQQADVAETRDNIARMERRISQLEDEKELYSNPAYIKEQARLRLGLIEPGETPFRILDPAVGEQPVTQSEELPEHQAKKWYETLWDSISIPPEPESTRPNPARDQATRPENLPTVPES
jgi:cell division protein FtsB